MQHQVVAGERRPMKWRKSGNLGRPVWPVGASDSGEAKIPRCVTMRLMTGMAQEIEMEYFTCGTMVIYSSNKA